VSSRKNTLRIAIFVVLCAFFGLAASIQAYVHWLHPDVFGWKALYQAAHHGQAQTIFKVAGVSALGPAILLILASLYMFQRHRTAFGLLMVLCAAALVALPQLPATWTFIVATVADSLFLIVVVSLIAAREKKTKNSDKPPAAKSA